MPERAGSETQICPVCGNVGYHASNCRYHKSNTCGKCGICGGSHVPHCTSRGFRPARPLVLTGKRFLSSLPLVQDEKSPGDGSEAPSEPTEERGDVVDPLESAHGEEYDPGNEDQEVSASEDEEGSSREAGKDPAKRKLPGDEHDESPRLAEGSGGHKVRML